MACANNNKTRLIFFWTNVTLLYQPATRGGFMRIGIIDLLHDRPPDWSMNPYGALFRKQFMGIMPQTIAVWCRQRGHSVHYRTYWGQVDPLSLLPDDLEVLFVSSYTQSSALAYAIATVFKRRGTLTVVGGPHSRSFPTDCARFFDIVVKDCNRQLVDDILSRRIDPPAVVSSDRALTEFPSVEERMPEIRISAFYKDRPIAASTVPMLSSIGCPYSCKFCVDWNSRYTTLSVDHLQADLEFLSRYYPILLIAYHDPNFAARFDSTMDVIERIPTGRRNRYAMESSLSILKSARLARLAQTNCVYVAPGIESWTEYSGKAGTGHSTGRDKLEKVIAQLGLLREYVPGIQTNFMFGADEDEGLAPVALTKEFIRRAPYIWPTINIPTAFGGTPLYDQMHRDGRILEAMPFHFYYNPYLALTVRNYAPAVFYDGLIELNLERSSSARLLRRLTTRAPPTIRFINTVRTLDTKFELRALRRIREMLASDAQFRGYHEGRSKNLPAFYNKLFERRLGKYAELLPLPTRRPVLEPPTTIRPTPPELRST
jgi:hypothetical protein